MTYTILFSFCAPCQLSTTSAPPGPSTATLHRLQVRKQRSPSDSHMQLARASSTPRHAMPQPLPDTHTSHTQADPSPRLMATPFDIRQPLESPPGTHQSGACSADTDKAEHIGIMRNIWVTLDLPLGTHTNERSDERSYRKGEQIEWLKLQRHG